MSGNLSIQSHAGGHGGYRQLKAYQNAEIIADATFEFCNRNLDRRSRTHDQMVQAARSGKQNIGEGSMASATSAKTELHLTNVALGSLEELRLDYEDYLRQHGLTVWLKDSSCALAVRALAYACDRSFATYRPYFDASAESAANALLCLINQTTYLLVHLLDKQLAQFKDNGGFAEQLYRLRQQARMGHRADADKG